MVQSYLDHNVTNAKLQKSCPKPLSLTLISRLFLVQKEALFSGAWSVASG